MAELPPETSYNPAVLRHLLDNWRQQAATAGYRRERDKGATFERLCIAYLQHDPIQARQYEQPMLYSDWAQAPERRNDRVAEPLGFYAEPVRSAQDLGIDLVAKMRDEDGWCAIQCKFHATGSRIAKKEIDSFLAASGHRDFRQRLIIDTTGREWSTQAEEMLRNQAVPVRRIGLQELQASPIRWQDFATSGEIRFADQRKLLPHQREAMEAVTGGLAELGSRGKMIMACGTGKTLTSLRIAEQLAGTGGRVLYLVPSLALMAQTVREWARDANIPLRSFAVCSDSQVGKRRRRNDDLIDMDALDLAFPATTDAVRLATVAAPPAPDALTVVFATYQSSPVIEEAQKVHRVPAFDLAVCDEAHRTAGALIEGEDPSHFVRIHSDKYIRCDRRLYMTATPKVYAANARTRAGKLAAALCSMEDERIYGPLLYELTFGAAVDQGLLTDYKVIVLTVPEDAAARAIQRSLAEDGELKLDDGAKLLGCWRALAKVDADQFPENDRAGMRRAISFCRDIKSSQQVERLFTRVAEEYREQEGTHLAEYPVAAQHVDGTFNAIRRSVALNWLDEADANGGCRVLTNARCLSEGVDVPALDAILFMHPRKSQIDVVQAVGRVMRKAPDKQMGYIVLPVVIPSLAQPEAALNDNKAFEVVWQTLNAIRSHDERFEGMINRIELGEPGDRIGLITLADWEPAATQAGDRPDIGRGAARDPDATHTRPEDLQPTLFDGLPEAIRAKIVDKCGDRKYWDEWAGDVADIARRHIERIKALVESGDAEREIFQEFVTELRDDLNEGITDDDAIEMLAQHLVTGPVFDALFGETKFVSRNPVSQGIQDVLDVLRPANIDAEAANLDEFYASVRRRVAGAATDKAKQRIVVELYDKFFRNAFPSMTQRLGIVYTPVDIVDFIIHSVNDVLEDEFGTTLGSEGVHILDPFTGTGTFVTRLLQSGLIAPEDLPRKYANEIHANEIVLLAYYIAAVNIETAYHDVTGGDYKPFEGICLTDTFEMQEGDDLLAQIMPDNSDRRTRQKEMEIRVIIGNPPWSAKQESANDNAANQEYLSLDRRIRDSYARHSSATNLNILYDSYIRAIRWASDRIGDSGVIGFVTNAGWMEGNAMDGMRKCLAEEFSSLYVFHLRGNARTQGEQRRKEKDNVFGEGSRAPVAVTILVKNPEAREHGRILFYDIGDYLDHEAKLEAVRQFGSIRGITEDDGWTQITPDAKYDWLDQRDPKFDQFSMIGSLNSPRKCNRFGSWHRKGQLVYFPWPFQTQLPTEALMGTYHQLTEHQRYQIYALKKAGHDQQSIAATVSVSPSTICRELHRNQGQRGYRPHQAHHKALARRRSKAKATKMTAAVIERIEADLRQEWSPEQIAGRLAATDGLRLSPQRIYQHIQADRQAGGTLYRHLRHSQKKRKKRYGKADARGQIKDRVSIDQRPAIVEAKSRIGDWEIDLVMGRAHTGALVSVVERRSRYTVLGKVASKQAEQVAATTIALLAPHKGHTQTITADNGKEFAHHATISQALDAAVYFAHPYHAWERGLNENTNGLIRQYVPKGTGLDTLSEAQIHHIMDRLNHRPRKGLAFQTPHEILCKETEVQPKHDEIALTS